MTTSTGPLRQHPPRIPLTIVHLAMLGVFGLIATTVALVLFTTGLALIPAVGIGMVLLVGVAYLLYGIAWFETERVAGLYGLDIAALAFTERRTSTFGGWCGALWRQLWSGRMWAALANLFLTSMLGTTVLALAQTLIFGIGGLISPRNAIRDGNILVLLLPSDTMSSGEVRLSSAILIVAAIAAIVGIAFLHRAVSVGIIGASSRAAALEAAARDSASQRAGAVRAADVERTRIERDLHDGVQPRLVSVGMTLGLAQQQIDSDPEGAKALIAEAHTSTKAAITELRQLARGIHASVLVDRGLDAALSALAGRSHIPVALDVRLAERVSRDAETAVYFVIAEALTNAAKHSRASECRVTVRLRDDVLWARVEDNGIGGARVLPGGGLDGIVNRVHAAGGTITLDSPLGGPTAMEVTVPCAS